MDSRFVGTFKLISFELHLSDGTVMEPYGDNPMGMAMYDKNGENWRHQVWPYLNSELMTDEHKEKVTYHGNLDMPRQFDGWSADFILGHCTFFEHHDCYYEEEKFKLYELVPSYLKKQGR